MSRRHFPKKDHQDNRKKGTFRPEKRPAEPPTTGQRIKNYFRPMTAEEAARDERARQAQRGQGRGNVSKGEPSLSHSRFGRDAGKFAKTVHSGMKTMAQKHAEWVEEGNKKFEQRQGGGPGNAEEGVPGSGDGSGRGSPFVRTPHGGGNRRSRVSHDDLEVVDLLGFPTKPVKGRKVIGKTQTDYQGLGQMFAFGSSGVLDEGPESQGLRDMLSWGGDEGSSGGEAPKPRGRPRKPKPFEF